MTEPGDPIEILLIEDNPGDVELTRHALRAGKICNHLTVVEYGADALAHLQATSADVARRPRLILLDLNLPDMSGLDILREVKADPALRTIPVVVLTASESETDVVRSYHLQAAGYVTKPIDHAEFVRAVLRIEDYWLCLVRLLPDDGVAAGTGDGQRSVRAD